MRKLDEIHRRTAQVYERHAQAWDEQRPRDLLEQKWLDEFIGLLPPRGRVLDAGCGAGEPIAGYLLKRGLKLTGLDTSPKMLTIARSRFPTATWVEMDMRKLEFEPKFDGIVSWDGFFHLTQDEQRRVLVQFAEHLSSEGSLLLTIGHESGEATGQVEGEEVYHSSLAPDEYKELLAAVGFRTAKIVLKDESCGLRSILLATRRAR